MSANENEDKVIRYPIGMSKGKMSPLQALKEIENEVMAGEVEHIIIIVHKKVEDNGDRMRWVSSDSDWRTKAAMASWLGYTVNKD